jgi:hypothetical protein
MAIAVLKNRDYQVLVKDLSETQFSLERNTTGFGNVFEALLQEVPAELRLTVYRHLSLALHPDRGGSTELMKQLNTAWDRLGR